MKDRNDNSGERKTSDRVTRFIAIQAPKPYEGVGRALSSAFPAVDQAGLPAEMIDLLGKLDRQSGHEA